MAKDKIRHSKSTTIADLDKIFNHKYQNDTLYVSHNDKDD